jgi:hypothetical protein
MPQSNALRFRASLYISAIYQQVILAPRIAKSPPLYPGLEEDSSYANDEPVIVLPHHSSPNLLGNRLKAILLASHPTALIDDERLRPIFANAPDKTTLLQEAASVPRKPPLYLDIFGKRPGKRVVKDPVLLASASDDYVSFASDYQHWFVEATESEITFHGASLKSSSEQRLTKKRIELQCTDEELGVFMLKL